MLQELQQRASELADSLNNSVLERMFLKIQQESFSGCTYALYLATYVSNKIFLGHLMRGRWGDPDRARNVISEVGRARSAMTVAHYKMYENPCGKCSACRSRKSQWPVH